MKRFLTLSLSAVILAAALSGCGAKSNETAAPADSGASSASTDSKDEKTDEKASSASTDSKDEKTDEKKSEEKGKDSGNSAAKATEKPKASTESDFSFEDLQNNYAILHDAYDFVEELYLQDEIAQDDDIDETLSQTKALIDEIGELEESDFADESEMIALNDQFVELIDVLQIVVDNFEAADTSDTSEVEEGSDTASDVTGTWELTAVIDADGNTMAYADYCEANGLDATAATTAYIFAEDGTYELSIGGMTADESNGEYEFDGEILHAVSNGGIELNMEYSAEDDCLVVADEATGMTGVYTRA